MDKDAYRIARLRELVKSAGGPAAFARRHSPAPGEKGIDPTFVSQILNGHRPFRERAVRNMEDRIGLPRGYFEAGWSSELGVNESPAPAYMAAYVPESLLNPQIRQAVEIMRATDHEGRIKCLEAIKWALRDHTIPRKRQSSSS